MSTMARLRAVDTARASGKVTELFGQVEKKLGRVPNNCLSAHTAIGKRLGLTEDEVGARR
jgi:hypothetical protein